MATNSASNSAISFSCSRSQASSAAAFFAISGIGSFTVSHARNSLFPRQAPFWWTDKATEPPYDSLCCICGGAAATPMPPGTQLHPLLRWSVLLWLLVWLPVNLQAWGWQNMMHFCDVGAIVACLGIFMQLPLLFSSQAVGSLLVGVLWGLD